MAPQVNWQKIMQEVSKLSDVDHLKTEVKRISQELRKFDINEYLSPTAKRRLKVVEQRYQNISKTINRTQRQVDREVNRMIRNLKARRAVAEKTLKTVKAKAQRKRLEKVSADLRGRITKKKASATKKRRPQTTAKKKTRKKTTTSSRA